MFYFFDQYFSLLSQRKCAIRLNALKQIKVGLDEDLRIVLQNNHIRNKMNICKRDKSRH